jgi:PAS domain S-box-containing protein
VEPDTRPFSPLLREIFDRMPAGVAVFDRELNVVEWNASFARFLQENRPDLAVQLAPGAPLAAVSPWDMRAVGDYFKRALTGETITLDASQYDGADGTTYWDIVLSPLYEAGEIVGVLDTTTEATRRVQAAREAAERESLFRLVFDATSDAVILNDFETGFVADANPAAARMHGYTREEFVGIDPSKFIHADSLPLLAKYQQQIREGRHFRSRAQDVRKDGSVFDVEVMGSSIEFRGKKFLAAVVRDISDQVAAENERARAEQVLSEARALLEQRVTERTRELQSVFDVSRAVLSTLDLDQILQRVLDEVAKVIPYGGCSVSILDGEEVEIIATRSLLRPDEGQRLVGARFRIVDSPLLWEAMLEGRSVPKPGPCARGGKHHRNSLMASGPHDSPGRSDRHTFNLPPGTQLFRAGKRPTRIGVRRAGRCCDCERQAVPAITAARAGDGRPCQHRRSPDVRHAIG